MKDKVGGGRQFDFLFVFSCPIPLVGNCVKSTVYVLCFIPSSKDGSAGNISLCIVSKLLGLVVVLTARCTD